VGERIEAEMHRVGFDTVFVDRVGNLVAHIGSGRGKRLLYDSHMDTVGVGARSSWTHDPYQGKVEDGYVYGRGASDLKGAIASMIYGVKALLDTGVQLAGDLYLACTVQEEDCEGLAQELLCQELRPDAVVLGEATDLQIYRGQRGRIEFKVTTIGRSTHGSAPERGINAIYLMNPVISGIERMNPKLKSDPLLGKGTIAVTHIESMEGSFNVIPDTCTVIVDRRLTLGEDEEIALGQMQTILEEAGGRAELEVSQYEAISYTGYLCRQRKYFPPWVLAEDHPLVQIGVRAIQRALGYRPRVGCWEFSTNGVASMGRLSIPTIGFGPAHERDAHTTSDRARIEDLFRAAKGYAQLAVEYLGTT
jgi:putative selenium metabolism hydrolase